MTRIHVPNRDTLVTALLILAGVLLAITLFGAGALWRGNGNRHHGSLEGAVPAAVDPSASVWLGIIERPEGHEPR